MIENDDFRDISMLGFALIYLRTSECDYHGVHVFLVCTRANTPPSY